MRACKQMTIRQIKSSDVSAKFHQRSDNLQIQCRLNWPGPCKRSGVRMRAANRSQSRVNRIGTRIGVKFMRLSYILMRSAKRQPHATEWYVQINYVIAPRDHDLVPIVYCTAWRSRMLQILDLKKVWMQGSSFRQMFACVCGLQESDWVSKVPDGKVYNWICKWYISAKHAEMFPPGWRRY